MATPNLYPEYDRLLDYLVNKATPQDILAFTISERERERAIELLDKQDEGSLTPAELAELHQMQELDELIGLLKAKALAALDHS